MRDRIGERFASLGGRAALVTFVTAGDPSPELQPAILEALVAGGADLVELGMPFTDPMADGPSIQAANLRALAAGITLRQLLAIVRDFRTRDDATPIVLMGYVNPVLAHGPTFARDAADAGIDGVILVDLPPEEADEVAPALREAGIHLIRLATPTTDARRLPAVLEGASGFLYHVAVAGITGQKSAAEETVRAAVARLKAATDLPVAVGFGVRTAEQAEAIARHADAVVVGSAIVDLIGAAAERKSNDIPGEVRAFVATLAAGVRGARARQAA
ncbi:MAG: tryptophan synthase subunit alpha [Sphingomonadaceae bacterium]